MDYPEAIDALDPYPTKRFFLGDVDLERVEEMFDASIAAECQ